MSNGVSRRYFLGGAFCALAGAVRAEAPAASLRPRLRPVRQQPEIVPPGGARDAQVLIDQARLGGRVSFAVADAETGRVLEGYGARTGQPPASVTKAVTALFALDQLGPDYRFQTRLLAPGGMENGVIRGDLVLEGGADPTLDTDALAAMAADLKRAGVREVRGRLRVWSGAIPFERVIDETQPEHVGYNPSISGLNLNFNRVHFEWKRGGDGYNVTMDARTARYRPAVRVARMAVEARKMPVYTYSDGGDHDSWTVARGALGKGGSRWLPVRKPGAYAAEVFAILARSHGIVLKPGSQASSAPGGRVLVTHKSEPLSEILRGMLKYSNNLTAEIVGMTASARRRGRPLPLRASAMEMSAWTHSSLGMTGVRLVDHSGLGEDSRMTAEAMAVALARVHGEGRLKPLLKAVKMRDAEGRVNANHPIKVTAKTGTLYFVSSLAGYMSPGDGTELAFAIFAANPELRSAIDRSRGGRPDGARAWNSRAKKLQQKLIERWGGLYGG